MRILHTLNNGIRIIAEKMPHVYSASVGIWIYAGSSDEDMTNNGIAHMIEHMLFKGTTNRTAKQLADDTAAVGGEINAYTSKEFTSFYACVLSEHLTETIELLSDMLNNSLFDEDDLEKEKNIVMDEIDMYKDSPEDVAHEMLQMKVWDSHPLGFLISGEKDIVKTFTSKQLREFMNDYYVGENIVISVAGKFDEDTLIKQLEKEFAHIKAVGKKKLIDVPVFNNVSYIETKDIEQIHLNLAFPAAPAGAKNRYAYTVMNNILGGGVNSRLFMRIREELGLTYSVYSYGSTFLNAGLFHICASLNPEQFNTVYSEIQNAIIELRDKGPFDDELRYAKEQIKTDILLQCESSKAIMNQNAKDIFLYNEVKEPEHILKMINAISKQDIKECLEEVTVSGMFGTAVVGNVNQNLREIVASKNNMC